MTKEQIKELYLQFSQSGKNQLIHWNNTTLFQWEYNFLVHIGAISYRGIKCDYPKLVIENDNKYIIKDLDGNLALLEQKAKEIKKYSKANVKIEYFPRAYCLYWEIRNELAEKNWKQRKAIELNTPPTI